MATDNSLGFLFPLSTALEPQEFDSNMAEDKKAYRFKLGKNSVIQGWEQGLPGQKKGASVFLAVPTSLGYGATGVPGQIPANSHIFYEIHVTKHKAKGEKESSATTTSAAAAAVPATPAKAESVADSASPVISAADDPDSQKARLMERMAKMGQAMLPNMGGTTAYDHSAGGAQPVPGAAPAHPGGMPGQFAMPGQPFPQQQQFSQQQPQFSQQHQQQQQAAQQQAFSYTQGAAGFVDPRLVGQQAGIGSQASAVPGFSGAPTSIGGVTAGFPQQQQQQPTGALSLYTPPQTQYEQFQQQLLLQQQQAGLLPGGLQAGQVPGMAGMPGFGGPAASAAPNPAAPENLSTTSLLLESRQQGKGGFLVLL